MQVRLQKVEKCTEFNKRTFDREMAKKKIQNEICTIEFCVTEVKFKSNFYKNDPRI